MIADAIQKAKQLRKAGKLEIMDVYKIHKCDKVEKGFDRSGEIIYGYPYQPDLFIKSDVSLMPCRLFVRIDGYMFHPDEIDRVSIAKDGVVQIKKIESLTVTFHTSEETTDKARSFDSALWIATATFSGKDAPEDRRITNNTLITISSKSGEITKTRAEWLEALRSLEDWKTRTVYTTFQQYCDQQ